MMPISKSLLTEDGLTEDCRAEGRSPEEDSAIEIPKQGMPVTIITGFLGSGKTTLLNHILNNAQGLKVAVLVNEFGDINIDTQLLVSGDQTMVELSNGCICCTINESLVDAVYQVLEREERIDYLVIETADPLPITLTFLGTELRDMTRLDSILTLVDAESFAPDIFESQAAYSQIAYGDIIILNKTDLVTSDRLESLEQSISDIKTDARIIRAEQGKVPLPLIIDVKVGDVGAYQEKAQEKIKEADLAKSHQHQDEQGHSHGHSHSYSHDHDHSAHDHSAHDHSAHDHSAHDHSHDHHAGHLENDGFVSFSFQCDGTASPAENRPFTLKKFQQFLDNHLPKNVFRAKGILWFQESPARHFFQLTGKRFQLEDSEWSGPRGNQLVFIGQGLDQAAITQMLEDCVAPVALSV